MPYKNKSDKYANNLKWYYNHKVYHKVKRYESWLKCRYGITADEYWALYESQGGKCRICGTTDGTRKDSKLLSVDHCHATGKIRGLLCTRCNAGLGHFQDNPVLLESALAYLRQE